MYERTSTTTCGCFGLSVNNPVTNKYLPEADFGKEEDIVQAVYGEDNGYIKKDVGDMVSMNSSWSSSEEKIRKFLRMPSEMYDKIFKGSAIAFRNQTLSTESLWIQASS